MASGQGRALLEADGFEVVGEAADGSAALEAVRRLRPEVVLLDVQLPGTDGFEVAERLAAEVRAYSAKEPYLISAPLR